MRRRLLAAAAALLLAGFGMAVLLAYVRGADSRALAGMATVTVLVVDRPVPAGTPGADLGSLVRAEQLPAKAAVDGRVTDLAAIAGQVATVDLKPGEQLLASRFAAPNAMQAPGTVAVPAGTQEVSVLLEPQRAAGGILAAGDTVGVFVSMADPVAATHLLLQRVLVTQVHGATAASAPAKGARTAAAASGPAPTGSLMVTLAVTAKQAEAVVFGAEHGTLWLSLEPAGARTDGTDVLTPGNLYGKVYS